jgi:carboxyl-terminal processing protease
MFNLNRKSGDAMRLIRIIIPFFCLLLSACSVGSPFFTAQARQGTPTSETSPSAQLSMSPEATKYLNDALDIIEKNSINKYKINWSELQASCFIYAINAQTSAETYGAIKCTLKGLHDNHSLFVPTTKYSGSGIATETYTPPPEVKLVQNKYGYVIVPGYHYSLSGDQFGTDMQMQIQKIDQQHPCGWIVDLRGNSGGDMWPMLIGIGPILGDGKAGSFVDADSIQTDWAYQDGKGLDNGQVAIEVIKQPYHLAHPNPPVAVLFDTNTASSGEVIVISFVGRPNTRSFGRNSAGLTTGNSMFVLSDGAKIVLTVANEMDRTGRVYGQAISPDVQVANNDPSLIPDEALQWLAGQPACK